MFPQGEPFAAGKLFPTLGSTGDVRKAVPVDVSEPQVMRAARRIFVRENMACPGCSGLRLLGDLEPDDGIGEGGVRRSSRIGDQIQFAIEIHVPGYQAMRTEDLVVDEPEGPILLERFVRAFQPKDHLVGAHEVLVAIPVDVEQAAMYATASDFPFSLVGFLEPDHLAGAFPVGTLENGYAVSERGHRVDMAVLVEIGSHRHVHAALALDDDVFFPFPPSGRWENQEREQKMEFRLFHLQILPQIFAMRAKVSGSCSLSSARTKG